MGILLKRKIQDPGNISVHQRRAIFRYPRNFLATFSETTNTLKYILSLVASTCGAKSMAKIRSLKRNKDKAKYHEIMGNTISKNMGKNS